MSAPTYFTAKELNRILTPYVPNGNSVTSPVEFIDILKTTGPGADLATLDVENLFTNVPIGDTIDYICDTVYRGDTEPIPIPEKTMRDLLYTCTSEVPFLSHRGELFRQAGGVSNTEYGLALRLPVRGNVYGQSGGKHIQPNQPTKNIHQISRRYFHHSRYDKRN